MKRSISFFDWCKFLFLLFFTIFLILGSLLLFVIVWVVFLLFFIFAFIVFSPFIITVFLKKKPWLYRKDWFWSTLVEFVSSSKK